ncbi:hypothetical protein EV421DRAFT_1910332 [Armillaria borealis]|uniref:Uncharacterized protein n=1 Tax=Armillaria borealis TaxID=47425 RepID=A0AA39J0N7_9AGAR|nr:hypothetical protein EV421DRAFT_1910332 [Armillaria borealis]
MPPIKKFDLFKVDQRFVLRRNCLAFMALWVRGPAGFPEREEWENEFMRGWHRKWPIFWEDERVDLLLGLTWAYYRVHQNLRPHDIEASGPIPTTIIWSIPLSERPKPKPRRPIQVKTNLVVLDGLLTTADVMGRRITRLIGEKQEAASSNASGSRGSSS